jgi:hypothetical protein
VIGAGRIKGVGVGFFTGLPFFVPGPAQQPVGMNGWGHLYLDGWQGTSECRVYGRGLVTEDYNVYGHKWSVQTNVYNANRSRSATNTIQWYSATTSSTASLLCGIDSGDFDLECILKQTCPYFATIALGSFFAEPPPVVVDPRVHFTTAEIFELSESFTSVAGFQQRATLVAAESARVNDVCGTSPQEFSLRANFILPSGATLVPSRSSARPAGVPDNDYQIVSAAIPEMTGSLSGQLRVPVRRRCCPAGDQKPSILVKVGCNPASGTTGVCDTTAVVTISCNAP